MKQCDINLIEEKPLITDITYPEKMGFLKKFLFKKEALLILEEWDSFFNEEKFKFKLIFFRNFYKRKGKTEWI